MYACSLSSPSWPSSVRSVPWLYATALTLAVTSATSETTSEHRRGVALCLLSAVGFGLMAVFAKKAYRDDVSVLTLLSVRFAIAACAFWAIVALRRARGVASPIPGRSVVLTGLALGAIGYAAQSGGYFGALTRIDASLTALLLYVYPALVFVGAVALGRDRVDRRRIVALLLATGGAALVLAGTGTGDLDALGVALGLGAAVAYAVYILVADRVVTRIDPFLISALIATGAAATLWTAGLVSGTLDLHFQAAGWAWIVGLALASTVLPISAFLAGLPKVGPSTASIVSTVEPMVSVAMAMLWFGERLGLVQVAGGALVLAAVVLLAVKVGSRVPPIDPAAPASARALASQPARG
jgi:drug/metabolite transporter (DMT)-like permease